MPGFPNKMVYAAEMYNEYYKIQDIRQINF